MINLEERDYRPPDDNYSAGVRAVKDAREDFVVIWDQMLILRRDAKPKPFLKGLVDINWLIAVSVLDDHLDIYGNKNADGD